MEVLFYNLGSCREMIAVASSLLPGDTEGHQDPSRPLSALQSASCRPAPARPELTGTFLGNKTRALAVLKATELNKCGCGQASEPSSAAERREVKGREKRGRGKEGRERRKTRVQEEKENLEEQELRGQPGRTEGAGADRTPGQCDSC